MTTTLKTAGLKNRKVIVNGKVWGIVTELWGNNVTLIREVKVKAAGSHTANSWRLIRITRPADMVAEIA